MAINTFDVNRFTDIYASKGQRDNAEYIFNKINQVVARSFKSRPCRSTRAEEDRRWKICFSFIVLMAEQGELVERVLDCLHNVLCAILDGRKLEFSDSALWQVEDSGIMHRVSPDDMTEVND